VKNIELEGVVTESMRNAMFKVQLDEDKSILAHISGKIRQNKIRINPGDNVIVQVSPYDTSKGRIVYRKR
jgi:translation initiation factor IF-1